MRARFGGANVGTRRVYLRPGASATERHELAALADRRRTSDEISTARSSRGNRATTFGPIRSGVPRNNAAVGGLRPHSLPRRTGRRSHASSLPHLPLTDQQESPSPHEHVRPAPARSFLRVPTPRRSSGSSTPKLDHLSRGFFALAAGACWRAVKDAGLFSVVDTGSLCELAAVGGHTALLRYARQHGCPWDTRTCEGAARGGHLGCLWFASKLGCPWDERTCQVAAGNGQLRCLRHAQETGCPWDGTTCAAAAEGGYLDCLRYAHGHGCPWDGATCMSAARGGHLECLRYAHENGCPWDENTTCMYAAEGGHLECLRYAHENGCPWDVYTCASAAGGGHLECLRYAHENGCPWDVYTCRSAARGGHLECLRYAHENGCPWDGATCASAAGGGIWSACDMHMRMDARGTHLHVSSRGRVSGVPAICT